MNNTITCVNRPVCMVTGGLGYIGSHVCVELLAENYDLIIIDNLSNSEAEKLDAIKKFNKFNSNIVWYQIDLTDMNALIKVCEKSKKIDVIIHMAGYKAVGESITEPLKYYQNNLITTLNLIKLMEIHKIRNFIFSSSATIYGEFPKPPYNEQMQTGLGITNPYGRSKFIQEEILKDISYANPDWNIIILRYFNPVGHICEELKENPTGIPNNLFPYIVRVHQKKLSKLVVFGNDYNTRDGTCTRDFVHVEDLANAHKACCNHICIEDINVGLKIYNVGTGKDTSVLELIKSFEKVNNCKINYEFGPRRQGDLDISYSDVNLIKNDLGWSAIKSIDDCVKL